jgi:hypothetical protein
MQNGGQRAPSQFATIFVRFEERCDGLDLKGRQARSIQSDGATGADIQVKRQVEPPHRTALTSNFYVSI